MKKSVLILSLILLSSMAYAVCTPPASGDWVVNGTEQCDLQDVVINGNVRINGSAVLVLNATNLTLNSSTDREFSIFIAETGTLNSAATRFYRINDTFDIQANESGTLNLTSTTIQNGTTIRLSGSATSILSSVNHSDDINTNDASTHTWTDLRVNIFEETGTQTIVFIDDNSTVTMTDTTIEGRVRFGQNANAAPNVTVHNGNFSGDMELRRSATVDFATNSTVNATNIYAQTPTVRGNVEFLSLAPLTSFAATSYTRYYPVYVRDVLSTPVPGAEVNITNSTGSVLFSGITDGSGFVLANMTYTLTQCGASAANCDNDFLISTNSNETLGIQTNTPIILISNNLQPVPEFSTWVLLLMVAGLLGSLVFLRQRNNE